MADQTVPEIESWKKRWETAEGANLAFEWALEALAKACALGDQLLVSKMLGNELALDQMLMALGQAIEGSAENKHIIVIAKKVLNFAGVRAGDAFIDSEGKFHRRVVYFLQKESGPIKIGSSIHLERRINALRTQNGEAMTLLHTMHGTHARESYFHQVFAKDRLEGEWFAPANILAFLQERKAMLAEAEAEAEAELAARLQPSLFGPH